jgi:hypothetical protein
MNKIIEVFSVLEPCTWPAEQIMFSWILGEKKLKEIYQNLKSEIKGNEFRRYIGLLLK